MSRQTKYQARIRNLALQNLGGHCSKCGSNNRLQIHHTNNDGWYDRRNGDTRSYVRRASKGNTHGLSCLCLNCHRDITRTNSLVVIKRELALLDARYIYCIGVN